MVRLGLIARSDHSGLGHQTRDLARLLKPDKILLVDFEAYNGFKQHPEWYKDYDTRIVRGFLEDDHATEFIKSVDKVLTCETFYHTSFINTANAYRVQTYNQYNYEFFDPLKYRHLLIPTMILSPSHWYLDDMKKQCLPGVVEYLPPPMFHEDYEEVRLHNKARTGKKKFLHVAGKMAAFDRAGTQTLLDALRYSTEDYTLVIKVQSGDPLTCDDPRVVLDYSFPEDERELYRDFDAMIMPRRYGGLNLPMNEALAAGIPVIMTNIIPNNILPPEWLVNTVHSGTFEARATIDLYSAILPDLGVRIDEFARMDLDNYKDEAYNIVRKHFDPAKLLPHYETLLRQ